MLSYLNGIKRERERDLKRIESALVVLFCLPVGVCMKVQVECAKKDWIVWPFRRFCFFPAAAENRAKSIDLTQNLIKKNHFTGCVCGLLCYVCNRLYRNKSQSSRYHESLKQV